MRHPGRRMDLLYNRRYLDPVLLSRSPGDPVELCGPLAADVIQDGDGHPRRTDGLPGGELLQPAVGERPLT